MKQMRAAAIGMLVAIALMAMANTENPAHARTTVAAFP